MVSEAAVCGLNVSPCPRQAQRSLCAMVLPPFLPSCQGQPAPGPLPRRPPRGLPRGLAILQSPVLPAPCPTPFVPKLELPQLGPPSLPRWAWSRALSEPQAPCVEHHGKCLPHGAGVRFKWENVCGSCRGEAVIIIDIRAGGQSK